MHHDAIDEMQPRWGDMQRAARRAACSGLDPCRVCSGSANGGLAVHDVRKGNAVAVRPAMGLCVGNNTHGLDRHSARPALVVSADWPRAFGRGRWRSSHGW